MNEVLAALFRHHAWANRRLIEACAGLPEELQTATAPGAYGGVRDTFVHLVGNEEGYLAVWQQTAPPGRDAFAFRDWDDVRARAERSGERSIALAERTEGNSEVRGEWREGPFALPTAVLVTQAINHATEHRAQVATILSQHGVAPPVLDGWTYDEDTGGDRARANGGRLLPRPPTPPGRIPTGTDSG